MIELLCYIRSEFFKLRHSSFFAMHILIPICGVIIVWFYSIFTKVSSINKFIAFIQIIAMVYPIIISIICELVAEQEVDAGHCQNILSLPSRCKVICSKLFFLLIMGFFSVLLSIVSFSVLLFMFDKEFELTISKALITVGAMWISNISLYILHLILAFKFGKNVCVSVGAVGSLTSALMETGLGTNIWFVCPYGLGIRLSKFAVSYSFHLRFRISAEISLGILSTIISTVILFVALILWFLHYNGKRVAD